jgi:hypothetical protein
MRWANDLANYLANERGRRTGQGAYTTSTIIGSGAWQQKNSFAVRVNRKVVAPRTSADGQMDEIRTDSIYGS